MCLGKKTEKEKTIADVRENKGIPIWFLACFTFKKVSLKLKNPPKHSGIYYILENHVTTCCNKWVEGTGGDCRAECRYCSHKALPECMFAQPVTCPNLWRRRKKKSYYGFPDRLTLRFRLTALQHRKFLFHMPRGTLSFLRLPYHEFWSAL